MIAVGCNVDERRRARRFPINLPVEVRVPSEGEGAAATARTRDVSFRGLYFTADREFQPGSPIEFILTLPREITLTNDVRVQCTGRVIRVEQIDAGKFDSERVGADGGWVGVAAVIEQYDFLPAPA